MIEEKKILTLEPIVQVFYSWEEKTYLFVYYVTLINRAYKGVEFYLRKKKAFINEQVLTETAFVLSFSYMNNTVKNYRKIMLIYR